MKNRKRILALLLALCLLLPLPGALAASAEQQEETCWLVKYREPPDEAPFHLVTEAELERLLDENALIWYAPDEELPLIEPEPVRAPQAEGRLWHLEMIGAETAWEAGYTGRGVRVGVVDSGIDLHPDFADQLVPGHNYIQDADNPEDTGDSYGHGTRVSGLIAGRGEARSTGLAPDVTLVPLKCTDGKTVRVSALLAAVYGGVDDYACDILNLSLGMTTNNPALQEAVAYAQEQGVLIVAAVGNLSSAAVCYPAGYDGVLGIGAVDESGTRYYKSNYNDTVFLTAPGANVLTTDRNGGYAAASGTSFSVPLVCAAAAVLRSADPMLTWEQVVRLLQDGAVDRGAAGWDPQYGNGVLHIGNSLALLPPEQSEPSVYDRIRDCDRGESCPMAEYADLRPAAWYHDGLHYVLETGLMVGVGETRFSPGAAVTRGMLATVLWRMEGAPASVPEPLPFPDLKPGAYYEKAVHWAAENGLVTGYPDGSFRPGQPITREELTTVLYRYAGIKGADVSDRAELSGYPDADSVSAFARDAVQWAASAGLLRGVPNAEGLLLAPKQQAERTQLAAMLLRMTLFIAQ